jgi:outer membrane biosynthesis protein TonB
VKGSVQKIKYCYEKALVASPSLKGTVQVQFFIKPDGTVASAAASGVDPDVATCVANVIRSLAFPKPNGGGGVQVNYPFTFRN